MAVAQEGVREKPVTFQQAARLASERLIAKVGESGMEPLEKQRAPVAVNTAG